MQETEAAHQQQQAATTMPIHRRNQPAALQRHSSSSNQQQQGPATYRINQHRRAFLYGGYRPPTSHCFVLVIAWVPFPMAAAEATAAAAVTDEVQVTATRCKQRSHFHIETGAKNPPSLCPHAPLTAEGKNQHGDPGAHVRHVLRQRRKLSPCGPKEQSSRASMGRMYPLRMGK